MSPKKEESKRKRFYQIAIFIAFFLFHRSLTLFTLHRVGTTQGKAKTTNETDQKDNI